MTGVLTLVITLLLFATACPAIAQSEELATRKKELKQLYAGIGAGPAFAFEPNLRKKSVIYTSHLNLSFSESNACRAGVNYALFSDNLKQYPQLNYSGEQFPQHEITSFYAGISKRKELNSILIIQAMAGISYNCLQQPKNIEYNPKYRFSILGGEPFIYEIRTLDEPGFIIQAEIIGTPGVRHSGLGLGTYYHYIPEATNGGFTLTYDFGLLTRE